MFCNDCTLHKPRCFLLPLSYSGWDDGKIRAFTPESGRLIYQIENAHKSGVTAIAAVGDEKRIISGGGEGEVRVWEIGGSGKQKGSITGTLKGAIKEHTGNSSCFL